MAHKELKYDAEARKALEAGVDAVANAVGDWPQDSWSLAMFPVKGHMDRLEERGKVRALHGVRPVKYELV